MIDAAGICGQIAAAMDRKDLASAAVFLHCSNELYPHFKALELLGECLLELPGSTSEAIITLSAAVGLGNNASTSLFLLARGLLSQGRLQDALEKLDLAIAMQPHFKAAVGLRNELQRGDKHTLPK